MRGDLPAKKLFPDRADLREGDPFVPPRLRRRTASYVEAACREARDLAEGEDRYEPRLLRLFRDEYVAGRTDGERYLARHPEEAASIVQGIERPPAGLGREAYLGIYEYGVVPVVDQILNGRWDEAYEVHAKTHRKLTQRFLGTGGNVHPFGGS